MNVLSSHLNEKLLVILTPETNWVPQPTWNLLLQSDIVVFELCGQVEFVQLFYCLMLWWYKRMCLFVLNHFTGGALMFCQYEKTFATCIRKIFGSLWICCNRSRVLTAIITGETLINMCTITGLSSHLEITKPLLLCFILKHSIHGAITIPLTLLL